jgi:hypothetical protein
MQAHIIILTTRTTPIITTITITTPEELTTTADSADTTVVSTAAAITAALEVAGIPVDLMAEDTIDLGEWTPRFFSLPPFPMRPLSLRFTPPSQSI